MKNKNFFYTSCIVALAILTPVAIWMHSSNSSQQAVEKGETSSSSQAPVPQPVNFCIAIRGNAEKIFTTMSSLARITESLGVAQGVVGGSSGSIASFYYESMMLNPKLRACNGVENSCTDQQVRNRLGLMMKSFEGYYQHMQKTPPIEGFFSFYNFMKAMKTEGPTAPDANPVAIAEGVESLKAFVTDSQYGHILNKAVVDSLTTLNPIDDARRIKRLVKVVKTSKANTDDVVYIKDDPKKRLDLSLLLQSGVPNMDQVAISAGYIGDFYAAYGPGRLDPAELANWGTFLDDCADLSNGKDWGQLIASGNLGHECERRFGIMARQASENMATYEGQYTHRMDEKVGQYASAQIPKTFVSISLLEGKGVYDGFVGTTGPNGEHIPGAKELYDGLNQTFDTFQIPQGSYKLGYFGNATDLQTMKNNYKRYNDFKSRNFVAIGQTTWHDAVFRSISEPGLSQLLPFDHNSVPAVDQAIDGPIESALEGHMLSAGGWSDAAQTLVMRNLGCQKVLYVSRQNPMEADGVTPVRDPFSEKITKFLGLTPEETRELLDVEKSPEVAVNPSFGESLKQSSAVWCTNWSATSVANTGAPGTGMEAVAADGYFAPMQVNTKPGTPEDQFFMAYGNAKRTTSNGCMPPTSF